MIFFNIYKIQFGFSKYILIYFFHIVPKNLKLIKMFKIFKIILTLIFNYINYQENRDTILFMVEIF